MSRMLKDWVEGSTGFPRVSGDEPLNGVLSECQLKFSPRERG